MVTKKAIPARRNGKASAPKSEDAWQKAVSVVIDVNRRALEDLKDK